MLIVHCSRLAIILLWLIVLCRPSCLWGQAEELRPLCVSVLDSSTQGPLADWPVALLRASDSSLVAGGITDEAGKAYFAPFPRTSTYILCISTLGRSVYAMLGQWDTVVQLNAPTQQSTLNDVAIEGRIGHPMVQMDAQKTVVQLDKSLLTAGLSLADMLKRMPGVSIDHQGAIKLKGRADVLVYVNDKPLYLDTEQLSAWMKSIPAEQVKAIELISHPSAKYDAEGSGGVINIQMLRNQVEGWNGRLSAGIGQGVYSKANLGGNVGYQKGGLQLDGAYQYNYREGLSQWGTIRTTPLEEARSRMYYTEPENAHFMSLQARYQLQQRHRFEIDLNGTLNQFNNNIGNTNSFLRSLEPHGMVDTFYQTQDHQNRWLANLNIGLDYEWLLDTVGSAVKVSFSTNQNSGQDRQLLFSQRTTCFLCNHVGTSWNSNLVRQATPTWIAEASYQQVFHSNLSLESGIKWVRARQWSDNEWRASYSETSSGQLHYQEQILAAYSQLNWQYGKWSLQPGLRTEWTSAAARSKPASLFQVRRSYVNLFPAMTVAWKSVTPIQPYINYSYKISRPEYSDLIPFGTSPDPLTAFRGNPSLMPQFTHNLELGVIGWEGALGLSLIGSHTKGFLAELYRIDGQRIISQQFNLDFMRSVGVNLTSDWSPTKWLSTVQFVGITHNNFGGNIGDGYFQNERTVLQLNHTSSFQLPQDWSAEVTGSYSTADAWGNMVYSPLGELSLGIQKKLWRERAVVRLSANDVFWSYNWIGTGYVGSALIQDDYRWDNRTFVLSCQYYFKPSARKANQGPEPVIEKIEGGKRR
jgi:iron complex outermembrane recepter protein